MKCPNCGELNRVYFDGLFFKCYTCGLTERTKKGWKELAKKWSVGVGHIVDEEA